MLIKHELFEKDISASKYTDGVYILRHYPVVWIVIQINIAHFIRSIRHCHKQHILGTTFCVGNIL